MNLIHRISYLAVVSLFLCQILPQETAAVKLDFFSPKEAAPWAASRRGSRRYSLPAMAFDAPTGGNFRHLFWRGRCRRHDASEGKVSGKRSRSSCEEIPGAAQDFQAAWPKMNHDTIRLYPLSIIKPQGFPLPQIRVPKSKFEACWLTRKRRLPAGSTAQCCWEGARQKH